MTYDEIQELVGKENEHLFIHDYKTVAKENLHNPGPDFIGRVFVESNINIHTLCNLGTIFKSGRPAFTGYLSILPVDQGAEHSAGATFSANPIYFDSENIVKLAIEGHCNAVASIIGCLAIIARKYAYKIATRQPNSASLYTLFNYF